MVTNHENYPRLGKNIGDLRKATGETQLALAQAIGAEGSNTISQYESGKRIPKRTYLLRIAKHFRVTENQLLYDNFDQVTKISDIPVGDFSFNMAMLEKMFPLVHTDKALENRNFKRAYEIHIEQLSRLRQGQELEDKVEFCIEMYKAAGKEGLVEATANHLWWLMICGVSTVIVTPRMMARFEERGLKNWTIENVLEGLLPSYVEDSDEQDFDTNADRLEFLKEHGQDIDNDILRLRKSKVYADLGEYYLALRHTFSLLNNTLSMEMNSAVGYEMLLTFAHFGNKYCRDCKEVLSHPSSKSDE